MRLESLLTNRRFYQEPHAALLQLRAEAPIYWSGGWGVWVITRHEDVVAILKNHTDFINFGRVTHLIKQLPDDIAEAKAALLFHYETGLAHTDPPIHSRLRGLLNRAFTPRMVAAWTARIETDDVIGNLVQIEMAGERLTLDELVSTVVTFFVAGHDTTTNLIANGGYLFMQQPEVMAELIEQPQLMKTAVEEILRLEPSVPRMWRLAARDYTLGDHTIRAGQMVFPMLSAANRDPAHFPNPDSFSLT